MFWFQITIPLILASGGLILLYADGRNKVYLASHYFESSRLKIVQFSERQNDKTQVRSRLSEIGRVDSKAYGEFRYRQSLLASIIALLPFIALIFMWISFLSAICLSFCFWVSTYFLYDRYLTSVVQRQRDQIESEFPAIIEMLTLAIAAGESPVSAFARIADRSDALLAREFRKAVQVVKTGQPFHESLDELGRNLKSSTIRRFVDALVMAMVRGAPVVDVLHRHVAEARINQRNLVMDRAGKAETTMMIPIVFLILPISVLFALWPSINQLSFFAS